MVIFFSIIFVVIHITLVGLKVFTLGFLVDIGGVNQRRDGAKVGKDGWGR